jgi:hypothetical protein
MQPGQYRFCAVCLSAYAAVFTSATCICNWLEARPHADFELFYLVANLHDHTSTLVSCALGAHLGHLGYCPIIQHEMDIAQAEAGSVKLDQDVCRAYER